MNVREIAKLAGVSRSTVSRVLNGREDVRAETRERVLAVVNQVDFRSQPRDHGEIGVFISRYDNEWFAQMLSGILDVSFEEGWHPSFHPLDDLFGASSLTGLYSERRLHGLIVVAPPRSGSICERLRRERVPHVIIQGTYDVPEINWVDINNSQAVCEATEHLIELGHTAIGLVSPSLDTQWLADRIAGYESAITRAGLPIDPRLQVKHLERDWPLSEVLTWWRELGVTAVVCLEYALTLAVHRALTDQHIAIPEAMSLVGFGDYHTGANTQPNLTTISQPARELGRRGVQTLKLILGGEPPPIQQTLRASLLVRASTGSAPRLLPQ